MGSKLLNDFLTKGIVPKEKRPTVGGVIKTDADYYDYSSSEEEEESNNDYAQKYVEKEMEMYSNFSKEDQDNAGGNALGDMDDVDSVARDLATSDIRSAVYQMARTPQVFQKYNFEQTFFKRELPIDSQKERILGAINTNNVVIVEGPTGCGKTTQVPQYILDDCRANGKDCNIVVTQPRKIATINVARRVCEERGFSMGSVVGYQVGLEKEVGPDVILTYMTTGVLLQKLIHAKNLNQYSHIILDEVHERNQDLDFLLLVIRKLLFTNSEHTRVILMSATIDTKEFAHYFRTQIKGTTMPAPIISIKEPNKFSTQFFYMEQIPGNNFANIDLDRNAPEIGVNIKKLFTYLVRTLDKADTKDVETNNRVIGSVLVFLPGIREIEDMEKELLDTQANSPPNAIKWHIIPLHSSLPNDEQAKAFSQPQPGFRKILLATNIAESSITVPDIIYVIDFCLTKNLTVNKITNFPSLQLEWATHVNCEQRAGRVGRVSHGRVFRLVTQEFYMTCMERKSIPEILRAPLDQLVLNSKMLQFNEEPKAILALALNPPNLNDIDVTISHLKELGAMLQTCQGRDSISDGDITFLGTVMAQLPMDVHLSKLIVLGHIFSVLHQSIIMAVGCTIQNIFSTPYNQKFQAYNKKLLWADGSCSDLIAMLNLYKVWESKTKRENLTKISEQKQWCKTNYVSLKGLREWQLMINEIEARLKRLGIEETKGPTRVTLSDFEVPTVLKVIICGAFYPHYFIRSSESGQVDERDAVKSIGGRDPFRTIFLTGIEPGQPGELYVNQVKKLLDVDNVNIGFDGTRKIYVEFRNVQEPEAVRVGGQQCLITIPGKILMQVYQAVKKRQIEKEFVLRILPYHKALDYLKSQTEAAEAASAAVAAAAAAAALEGDDEAGTHCFSGMAYDPIPPMDMEYIKFIITQRVDAGTFWAQNADDFTQDHLNKIQNIINRIPLKPINISKFKLDEGKLYACKFQHDNLYYRCKVESVLSKKTVSILYVDYGNMASVELLKLCELPPGYEFRINPLAFECVLCKIQPSLNLNPMAIWSDEANKRFDSMTQNQILYGKVYSVVDNVVHLEVFKDCPDRQSQLPSLNRQLIIDHFAEEGQESFLSKENHDLRQAVLSSENPNSEATRLAQPKLRNYKDGTEIKEEYMKHTVPVVLKGPYSPLEMKVHGVIVNSAGKKVDIEPTSVNSVLLDNNPQDPHARLVVSAQVNQTSSGDRLVLRQTSVMPNVPGFPAVMALLFCPYMEPKLTEDRSKVASILCGLGHHANTKKSKFSAHDLVLTMDVEVNEDLINQVNEVRYTMNTMLSVMQEIHETESRNVAVDPYQRSAKTRLFDLLGIKPKSVQPSYNKHPEIWNERPLNAMILEPASGKEVAVWPLHWFIQLEEKTGNLAILDENIKMLRQMAKKLIPFEPMHCFACKEYLEFLGPLRNHLISSTHKSNVLTAQAAANIRF